MFSLLIYSRTLHITLFVSTNFLNIDANWYDSRPTSLRSFSNLVCDTSMPGDMFIFRCSCVFFIERVTYGVNLT